MAANAARLLDPNFMTDNLVDRMYGRPGEHRPTRPVEGKGAVSPGWKLQNVHVEGSRLRFVLPWHEATPGPMPSREPNARLISKRQPPRARDLAGQ